MNPIYKVWKLKYAQPWYALGKPARDELMGKVGQSLSQAGGKLLLSAASLWADEKWTAWGIEEYPDLDGAIKHSQTLSKLQWYRYIKSWSCLGTRFAPESEVIVPKAAIYRLVFFKMTDAGYRLSESEHAQWNEKLDQVYKQAGTQSILTCGSDWCNEQWSIWTVEAYPSLEAVQQHALTLFEMDWHQYTTATSLIGVKWPPD